MAPPKKRNPQLKTDPRAEIQNDRDRQFNPSPSMMEAAEFHDELRQFIEDLACYGQPEHMLLNWREHQSIVRRAVVGACKLRKHPGFVMLKMKGASCTGGSETNSQRLIAAWKEGTARWQREHESFPTAYFKLASVVDEIERLGTSPNKA